MPSHFPSIPLLFAPAPKRAAPSSPSHPVPLLRPVPSLSCGHLALRPMMKRSIKQSPLLFIHSLISVPPSLLISLILLFLSAFMIMMTKGRRREMVYVHRCSTTTSVHSSCLKMFNTDTHPQTRLIYLLFQPYKTNWCRSRPAFPLVCWWDKQVFNLPLPPSLLVTSHACIKRDTLVNPHSVSHCISWTHHAPIQVYKPEPGELMNS